MVIHVFYFSVAFNERGWYVPKAEFQNLAFRVLRRKPCRSEYFTIVFERFSVAVAVLIHLIILSPFLMPYVAVSRQCHLSKYTLTRPLQLWTDLLCMPRFLCFSATTT